MTSQLRTAATRAAAATVTLGTLAAPAWGQLEYDRTTFLHGLGSYDTIWTKREPALSGLSAREYLSRRVVLREVGTPYLNAGAQGPKDSTRGLRYADQRNNLVRFVVGAPGTHVLVGHSLGNLVARGAYRADGVGPGRVAGIVSIAAPHRGALIADSAVFAVGYVEELEQTLAGVKSRLKGMARLWRYFGWGSLLAPYLAPGTLVVGHQYRQLEKGIRPLPTANIEGLVATEALKDLGPGAGAVLDLRDYTGDGAVPRANIRGSIPIEDAILRLAASTGNASFEELRRAKREGLSGLRTCRDFGLFGALAPSNKCARAAALLRFLDDRWAAWVNGTEVGPGFDLRPDNTLVPAQHPRRVPFDGIVPNESSVYPTVNGLVADVTVPGTNHQDIYRVPDGLNATARAMLDMRMQEATRVTASLSGSSDFASSRTLTWSAAAAGGDGAYAYEWSYDGGTGWRPLARTGAAASRSVTEYTPSFTVRVVVKSQGQTVTLTKLVRNTSIGCVQQPGGPPCPL